MLSLIERQTECDISISLYTIPSLIRAYDIYPVMIEQAHYLHKPYCNVNLPRTYTFT
jgi:hypothetical protein